MDDKQPDMKFPQNFMNHIKSDPSDDVFNQDASKQKTTNYPSVDGLPKYSQTNQLQFMVKNVIKSMMNHKYASPFARPVDKKIYMDYYDIIKRPMDLGFIKKKLIGKHYQSVSDCIADFKQMFENCETYNQDKDDPEILRMNDELKKYFYSKIAKLPVKEQPLTLKGKTTKKNPRTSFSGSINGSNYDGENSSDDDVISHKSGIGMEEHTNSPSAFSFDPQERRMEETGASLDSESRKFLKRKAEALGSSSPNKNLKINKGSSSRQVPKRSAKEFKLPENTGQDIDIGDFPPSSSMELRYCFEILREFYKRPLSARSSRYYQLENKPNGGDTDEDVLARKHLFMDLNTVLKKFKQNDYQEPDEFATDMRKIFTFIYRFSKNSPSLVKETQDIQNIFELRFAQVPFPKKRQQSIFNVKIDSLIKVVKNIEYQLENLKVKEPPLKRRKISNDMSRADTAVGMAGSVPPLQNNSNDRLQQKPKSKPKAPISNNSSHPPNKSPVNRSHPPNKSPVNVNKSQQPPQKPQASTEKEIPREFAAFIRPNAKDQAMNDDEMSKLSFVLSTFNEEKLAFLTGLINYAEPVENPFKEITLEVEKLKPSTLRAIERFAIYCVGSEKYSHITEHLDKKLLPLCAGQYKIPQPPSKSAVAPKSLHQHNKNSSIGFSREVESSSSNSCSNSSTSNSSSSLLSSPEMSRPSNPVVANTKPPSQQFSADQSKSLNGDSNKKPVPQNVRGPNQSASTSKSSDSSRTPNVTLPVREPASNLPTEDEAKPECQNAKSSPELTNKNPTPSFPSEKASTSEEKTSQAKPQPTTKDSGVPAVKSNDHVAASTEDKNEGGVRFPAWGSMLQKSKSSAPQLPIHHTNETFILFKKQAEEREREKLSKQQQEERRHRMERENDELLKKEKELKQAQDEEDALFGALGKTKPPEPQPGPSRPTPSTIPAPTNSHPASPKNDNQQVLSPSERRLIEQQRRKNAARACQIDLNAQSEIFAAFERDLHGQSLMNH